MAPVIFQLGAYQVSIEFGVGRVPRFPPLRQDPSIEHNPLVEEAARRSVLTDEWPFDLVDGDFHAIFSLFGTVEAVYPSVGHQFGDKVINCVVVFDELDGLVELMRSRIRIGERRIWVVHNHLMEPIRRAIVGDPDDVPPSDTEDHVHAFRARNHDRAEYEEYDAYMAELDERFQSDSWDDCFESDDD